MMRALVVRVAVFLVMVRSGSDRAGEGLRRERDEKETNEELHGVENNRLEIGGEI